MHLRHRRARPQRPFDGVDPAVGRACATSAGLGAGPARSRSPPAVVSIERIALPSASANERPIAIASPTVFIVVVSSGSAPGNFSNANRGILTTT